MSDPFERWVKVEVEGLKSPQQRSRALAAFAREDIAKERLANDQRLGKKGRPPRITVDGKRGVALGTVKPNGRIEAELNTESTAVRWILRELELLSPTLTGAYERSHTVFADGVEIDPARDLPDAREFVIASDLPYAKKLDPKDGLPARSKQAPKGVYASIAAVAATRFANEADIRFTFRDIPLQKGGTSRNPAIVVRLGGDGVHV